LIYKGRVQGVGFRYTVEIIAHDIGVSGWVRNLPNGNVEITAEGTESKLNDLLKGIEESSVGKFVTKREVIWQEYHKEFTEFRVEFIY
jgi:acylphosphatase